MADRITWKWIRENYFPSFVADAARAGIDPQTLVLYNPNVSYCLFKQDPGEPGVSRRDPMESGMGELITEFTSPADAERFMNGMRRGWSLLPAR